MELCADRAGEWASIREAEARAGRTPAEARADLAGLTQMVKRRFGRYNWPFSGQWGGGDEANRSYRTEASLAELWRAIVPQGTVD